MSDPTWSRRTFHRNTLAALGALACAPGDSLPLGDSDIPVAGPPGGVILITADDLGWRDLSAYGLTPIATPNIDRLVREGVAFDRAFDVVSTCSSSRATYATGQYPHTHGVTGLVHRNPELSLPSDRPTVARAFQDAGWATAIQGKWHLSSMSQPEPFGYDTYLDTNVDQVIRDSQAALIFLRANRKTPFFLELNYMQPHRDVNSNFPQEPGYEVDVDAAVPPEWWGLPNWPEIREEVAGYLSRLLWMDALIGEVLDELDTLGMADDTLVVFISDNGPAFPGCKLTLYDRGVGTPLMFRWPRRLAPARHDQLVSSITLAPTLLDLAGLAPLPNMQGRSLGGLLTADPAWVPHDALFMEMERHGGEIPARAVRTATHKYIVNHSDTPWGGSGGSWKADLAELPDQTFDDPRPPEELYDLLADPLERTNLIGDPDHATVLADLRARLNAHMDATDDPRRDG